MWEKPAMAYGLQHTPQVYMPLPPPGTEDDTEQTQENEEDPQLQFSVVECLMHAFHCLVRKQPDFLAAEENADRLKDFRIRLQYFARGVQSSMKQLRLALKGKAGAQLKTEENKIKVVALRITSNINTLIKDLMHNPPSYKSNIVLSWKPIQKQGVATSPETAKKRPHITPITFESDKKVAAGGRNQEVPRTVLQEENTATKLAEHRPGETLITATGDHPTMAITTGTKDEVEIADVSTEIVGERDTENWRQIQS
ncbi:putative apoptosis inhibitor 5 [Apostichopus japonicus]|uniref:Putative apoptosis inhibitor 5 n=1 Tax=Stichopus japonicus TaxID=307972 RepID=A0A2G8JPQ5_STIJA|nr:putative apoptosis inhibitor 5 [Apostichopus japonicus]